MSVALRPGGVEDAALLNAIYLDAVLNGTAPHYTPEQARAFVPGGPAGAWLIPRLAAGRSWIAAPDRGFLAARVDGFLDLFFVRPPERRGPVAPALYDAYAAWLDAAGIAHPATHASRLLRPFLERRGWRVVTREVVRRKGTRIERFGMRRPRCPRSDNR